MKSAKRNDSVFVDFWLVPHNVKGFFATARSNVTKVNSYPKSLVAFIEICKSVWTVDNSFTEASIEGIQFTSVCFSSFVFSCGRQPTFPSRERRAMTVAKNVKIALDLPWPFNVTYQSKNGYSLSNSCLNLIRYLSTLILWKLYPFVSLYRPNYRSCNLQICKFGLGVLYVRSSFLEGRRPSSSYPGGGVDPQVAD